MRIPHADGSLCSFPPGGDEEAFVMLSDILPTGFECGVMNGQVNPGDTVAIVGTGPSTMLQPCRRPPLAWPSGIAVRLPPKRTTPSIIDLLAVLSAVRVAVPVAGLLDF